MSTSAPDRMQKRAVRFPHTYALILGIIAVATALTSIVPAGEYDMTTQMVGGTERDLVVDGSYHHVEQSPVSLFEMVQAIPKGLVAGSEIVFYIFLVAGSFAVLQRTGAIEALVGVVIRRLGKRDLILIPVLMFTFSVLGFTIGLAEEAIVFVPIVIAIVRSFGYDAVTGAAMVILGAGSGFSGGMFNPFTVGIAQGIAQVQLFSGWQFRTVPYLFFLTAAILYVIRYAHRVKQDPSRSHVADLEQRVRAESPADYDIVDMNARHVIVLLMLAATLGVNIYGIFTHGWFLTELTAMFIGLGVLGGIVGGLGVNGTFTALIEGMQAIVFGAVIVGFARAILVILEDGVIVHTILNALATLVGSLPSALVVLGMLLVQLLINVFIPSGSGQAAATMPIMAPLADLLGIDRQVAVLAFQYGDGLSNSIIPTSASLLASLAIAQIPYERWVRFLWPLTLTWVLIAAASLIVAVAIGLH